MSGVDLSSVPASESLATPPSQGLADDLHPLPNERRSVDRQRRGALAGWVACVFFLAVSLSATWYCRGERSAWALINVPGDPCSRFTLLGYNFLLGPDPVMQENEPFVNHVAYLGGVRGAAKDLQGDIYIFRPYYGLFATLLAPLFGIVGAMLAVNWLAWALCAWVTWRLSRKLFADELAALLAVVFVTGGMGMIYHIGDYSPHLLSFATYYLGVYLLYDSGILFERKPFRTHLLLGAYLAVAGLAYPGSTLLTALYILAAVRHNAPRHIAGGVLLAVTSRPLWKVALWLSGVRAPDIEARMLIDELLLWRELLHLPWLAIGRAVAAHVTKFGLFDSPLVVVLGLLSCFYLPGRKWSRWFGVAVLGLPLLLSLVAGYGNVISAYPYYGISILVYCWLGCLLARGFRGRRGRQLAAGGCLGLVIASQFAWSTAYLWSGLGPLKTYIAGWPAGLPHFVHHRAEVVSLTGAEETPTLFGGGASLTEAGAHIEESSHELRPGEVSFGAAFGRRLLLCAYLGLMAIAWAGSRRWYLLAGGAVLAALVSAGLSWATFHARPTFHHLGPVVLPPDGKLTFRAALSPSFLDRLRGGIGPGDSLCFYIPETEEVASDAGLDVSVAAGPAPLPVADLEDPWLRSNQTSAWAQRRKVQMAGDAPSAVRALEEAGEFTLTMVNRTGRPLPLAGWQCRGLPGRQLVLTPAGETGAETPGLLPAVEIRLMRPDGSIKVAGF
jgi:hypothetical protein